MEEESKVSVDDAAKNPGIFSRNSRVTEIFELVMNQPRAENEMESMLLNFWNKYDGLISREDYFCDFDVLCMHMLDCVFKRNGPTQSAVSRSLYCYLKCLGLSKENRKAIISDTENNFVNSLSEFVEFSSEEGEDLLMYAMTKSLLEGNYGLTIFLLKFGLIEIPKEANEKSRKIIEKLVDRFNNVLRHTIENGQAEDTQSSVNLPEMLLLMKRKDINYRRSLLTFFLVVAISEFQLIEKLEDDDLKECMNLILLKKLMCLYEVLDATTEAKFNIQDIETFIVKILNPLLTPDFGKSLAQFSKNIHRLCFDTLKPRSLKDLSRSTIRENLQSSMTFPEQVNQFDIPVDLKKFLLYHCKGIFELLKRSHHTRDLEETINIILDENLPMGLEI